MRMSNDLVDYITVCDYTTPMVLVIEQPDVLEIVDYKVPLEVWLQ